MTLFAGDLGIQKEHLPVWRYSSKDGKQTTFRWFVDKPLVFKSGSDETIRFGFVDPGFRTAEAFASFLRNYRPLFSRLDRFEVVYIAGFESAIEPARRMFDRLVSPGRSAPEDPIAGDILTYFADRKEHAINGLAAFDQRRLDRYREARRQFSGTRFDELFEVWKQRGDSAVRAANSPESRPDLSARGTFAAHVLNFNSAFSAAFTRPGAVTNAMHVAVTFAHPSLSGCGLSHLPSNARFAGKGGHFVAAQKARNFTGATPAFVAVARHDAFSSLLSSLRGSPQSAACRGIYEFANI